jgi:peptidoglycan/LPS O-acetylase OafA/YrhL
LALNCDYDYICAPVFVFCIGVIIKSLLFTRIINKILLFVGKYSTYIWLTHTFFAYYYFQQYLYWFKYSTIIYIVCLICCIIVGIVIEFIIKFVKKLFNRNNKMEKDNV